MIRTPRLLVITSCSDLKTEPSGTVKEMTRALQKEIRTKQREVRQLRAQPERNEDGSQRLETLEHEITDLRHKLSHHMLLAEDFRDPERLARRESELTAYRKPAAQLYAGPHHEDVMKGIGLLREAFGQESVDLKIISAGYGLIDEEQPVVPYDVTFSGMDPDHLDEMAGFLGIHGALEAAIRPYDMVIFLLGKEYLRSVRLPLAYEPERQRLLFVSSESGLPFLDYDPEYGRVMVGNQDVHDFGVAAVSLKGRVFRLFAEGVAKTGWEIMSLVKRDPNLFKSILDAHRKASVEPARQLSLFDQESQAANTRFPMTYFMPENEDKVDANYNPWWLLPSDQQGRDRQDSYAHELLAKAPYDGMLISLHKISRLPAATQEEIYAKGARAFLRYEGGPLLGDCGAFTFDEQGAPPFDSHEVLESYRKLGVDMGVSVDYLIFPSLWSEDPVEAERRFEANLEEARRFWEAYQESRRQYPDWQFTPIGVAQGGTPERFITAVAKLQETGYRYIAIGGLALSPASVIREALQAIAQVLLPETQVHLFGFGKLDMAGDFRKLGVTSFDSTSPLVQGFMRGVYWDPETLRQYAAIRVPFSDGKTAKRFSGGRSMSYEESLRLERATLEALRAYGENPGEYTFVAARDALVAYDRYLHPWPYNQHIWQSIETLRDRPWEKCDCKVCQEWGIATAILRSNNHNRRRGFHNTWVFYNEKLRKVGPGMTQVSSERA